MKKKKTKRLTAAAAVFSAIILALSSIYSRCLPDSFAVPAGSTLEINGIITVSEKTQKALAADTPVNGSRIAEVRLFGIIPLKSVNVRVVEKKYVVPCGTLFGLKIFTDGVLVVGMTDVSTKNGPVNPAQRAGIKIGDVIISMDGQRVNSSEDVAAAVQRSAGSAINTEICRKNMNFNVEIIPAIQSTDNSAKIGLWVRDSSAGIGTMTFYDPESGIAAGLGHAICDVDTGEALPIMSGEIVGASILGITKGESGKPGEIRGRFKDGAAMGNILKNTETGVYSKVENMDAGSGTAEVALKQEVKKGSAQILTTLDESGKPQCYDCIIEKVYYSENSASQNMVIKITDETLLARTGGIIQGMSGSPIMQNGKLAGAVTHVFVNDPTHGYGIFAENMYNSAEEVLKSYSN